MRIRGDWLSDIGQRDINQDAVIYCETNQEQQYFVLCGVCDGVGGLKYGEVASSFLAERAKRWFDEVSQWLDIVHADMEILFSHLKDAVEEWNEGLWELCQHMGVHMGSTMSLLMVIRDCYYIIQVGDSRIYRYRGHVLEQLTRDDSVARMKNGRPKNYLANYMGKASELSFQALMGRIELGDFFMSTSDGFYHHLREGDIKVMLKAYEGKCDLGEACSQLIRSMLERGERDNISICVLMVQL